jgi:hypothetical protein
VPPPTVYVRSMAFRFAEPVPLTGCSGLRDREGMPIPCPTVCVVHFDAWADPRAAKTRPGWRTPRPETACCTGWVTSRTRRWPRAGTAGNTPATPDAPDLGAGLLDR